MICFLIDCIEETRHVCCLDTVFGNETFSDLQRKVQENPVLLFSGLWSWSWSWSWSWLGLGVMHAPIKIIGIKIIVPKKAENRLRLTVHISKILVTIKCP
jgi:hypothetical protein